MTESNTGAGLAEKPFRILTVCTGNICRSPMAERLLQAGFDARVPGQFVVKSAGTGALVGNPINPRVEGFIRLYGGSADNFSARQLTHKILVEQDLVLALTRQHRGHIVEMAPALLRKTFTLRELARLLPHIRLDESLHGVERWHAGVSKALRARSAIWSTPEDDDVVDPYKREYEVFQQMSYEIASALQAIRTVLR
ncbi:protein-tyrosine phosphatase [Arthrobacter sp. CAN_A214]|uniref:arsenate reductase/protein-tyrosine-phosphatase family protein n=1 Tax=Arthrobacter sp. CAN_A214 TaxID=2787720 RepID=UPI0018CA20AB